MNEQFIIKKKKKDDRTMEKDKGKEKKKRNLNTVEHSIKKEKINRTFLEKIDSCHVVSHWEDRNMITTIPRAWINSSKLSK